MYLLLHSQLHVSFYSLNITPLQSSLCSTVYVSSQNNTLPSLRLMVYPLLCAQLHASSYVLNYKSFLCTWLLISTFAFKFLLIYLWLATYLLLCVQAHVFLSHSMAYLVFHTQLQVFLYKLNCITIPLFMRSTCLCLSGHFFLSTFDYALLPMAQLHISLHMLKFVKNLHS